MRRLPLILGLALIVALTIWEIYDFFVTNEGVRYFSSEPGRLVYVVLLALAGGLVAFAISRLSRRLTQMRCSEHRRASRLESAAP
jgi:hypothetical protein